VSSIRRAPGVVAAREGELVADLCVVGGYAQYAIRPARFLLGYFMPHEGTNNIALALVSLESLAAYETYRQRVTKADAEGVATLRFAQEERFILSEERTFLRGVPETLGRRPG
jgi:hypothetical protein